ncbi:MAG: hypothetical protein GY710_01255 [Desulfobacteraceae bacterium]|nr:hypothetical protein [Desulfobacteraceae bacterium]
MTHTVINTSLQGVAAANPPATGYSSNPGFDITQAQFFLADENSNWIGGPLPIPPTGQPTQRIWNYWNNLIVMPNPVVNKGYHIKYEQPPLTIDDTNLIFGWDDLSVYHTPPIVADDWICKDDRPVTDIHWWGSFIGWTQPYLPPVIPSKFHIGIWTDVPATSTTASHPDKLIWENISASYVWNFAGYDKDPREELPIEMQNEACFQFNLLLSQDDWFYQQPDPDADGTVYWLSIAAIYDNGPPEEYAWGWKTRPVYFNDNAVRIYQVSDSTGNSNWPPTVGYSWSQGQPVKGADKFWDLSFELTTNTASTIVSQSPQKNLKKIVPVSPMVSKLPSSAQKQLP